MESYNVIPVIWGIDKKYILQAFVVMRSILMHSKEMYHFMILTADRIQTEVEDYAGILKTEYDNFEVFVKTVDMNYFENAPIYNDHLSKAAYFRLLIPELFPEYDKCIYLDCDIIVHGDLAGLYLIDVKDMYLAGVKDCHIIADNSLQVEHQRILGLPSRDKYINSGVLVMNLRRMRKDDLMRKFHSQITKENWYEDQDVLNYCCYPDIKILPLKYNLFHFYLGDDIEILYDLPYEKSEFDFNHDMPYILHMGGRYKPWLNDEYKGSNEWWQLAKAFKGKEAYQFYSEECQRTREQNKIRTIVIKAKKSRNIVVWGHSEFGRRLCDILLEYQLDNIVAIADNNEAEWGKNYCGIPVMEMNSIIDLYDDIMWIIACQMSYCEVMEQLAAAGIEWRDMIRYIDESYRYERMYLLALREDAYERRAARLAGRKLK